MWLAAHCNARLLSHSFFLCVSSFITLLPSALLFGGCVCVCVSMCSLFRAARLHGRGVCVCVSGWKLLMFQSRCKHTIPCAHSAHHQREVNQYGTFGDMRFTHNDSLVAVCSLSLHVPCTLYTPSFRVFHSFKTIKIGCVFFLHFGIRICFPARANTLFETISTWTFCGVSSHVCLYLFYFIHFFKLKLRARERERVERMEFFFFFSASKCRKIKLKLCLL